MLQFSEELDVTCNVHSHSQNYYKIKPLWMRTSVQLQPDVGILWWRHWQRSYETQLRYMNKPNFWAPFYSQLTRKLSFSLIPGGGFFLNLSLHRQECTRNTHSKDVLSAISTSLDYNRTFPIPELLLSFTDYLCFHGDHCRSRLHSRPSNQKARIPH